jgi:Domain of unknown function (DUF3523)
MPCCRPCISCVCWPLCLVLPCGNRRRLSLGRPGDTPPRGHCTRCHQDAWQPWGTCINAEHGSTSRDDLHPVWQGVTELLTDSTKLATGIAGVTLLALGIYATREGVRVAGRTFDRWFGTPALVRFSLKFRLAGSRQS